MSRTRAPKTELINDVERARDLPPLTKIRLSGVEYLLVKPDRAGCQYCVRLPDGELVRIDPSTLVEVISKDMRFSAPRTVLAC